MKNIDWFAVGVVIGLAAFISAVIYFAVQADRQFEHECVARGGTVMHLYRDDGAHVLQRELCVKDGLIVK